MPTEQPRPPLRLGYWLSSEEHDSKALVRNAARAEQAGFTYAGISDHLHPWTSQQGQSPFVWSVLGAIASVTNQLHLTTGVTAPIIRMHPVTCRNVAAGEPTSRTVKREVWGLRWPLERRAGKARCSHNSP